MRKPFDRLVDKISKTALGTPSMMTGAERQFLFGLAAEYYTGRGAIVDAGLFMGASTVCLGEGLKRNLSYAEIRGARPKPITSLERGIVNTGMPAFFKRHNIPFSGEVGDSFEEILRKNIAPVADDVDLRVGDILESDPVDGDIEILYLDVIKSIEIQRFVFDKYFPRLIPGRSIVLQQDYFIDLLPFLKTYQEAMADHFTYIGEIGPMAVFLCTSRPEGGKYPDVSLSEDAQIDLASVAMQRSIDPARRFMMAMSKMRLIKSLRGAEAARHYLKTIEGDFPEIVASAEQPGRLHDVLRSARAAAASHHPGPPRIAPAKDEADSPVTGVA